MAGVSVGCSAAPRRSSEILNERGTLRECTQPLTTGPSISQTAARHHHPKPHPTGRAGLPLHYLTPAALDSRYPLLILFQSPLKPLFPLDPSQDGTLYPRQSLPGPDPLCYRQLHPWRHHSTGFFPGRRSRRRLTGRRQSRASRRRLTSRHWNLATSISSYRFKVQTILAPKIV